MIKLSPVKSSSIQAIGYDPANSELHVQFSSGHSYAYTGVSPEQHQAFANSESKGKHFHSHIRGLKSRKLAA